jgi:alkylation response protein AidB-like acyl-CoA dehydrogenase
MLDKRHASFMRSLARGEIEEEILLPFPEPRRVEREPLSAVLATVGALLGGQESRSTAGDPAGSPPPAFLGALREAGLLGLVVPEDRGGVGLSAFAHARVLQEVARFDASVALTLGAHGVGVRGLLLFGTEEQKARYLPRLATGELVAASCLAERDAGQDPTALTTTAVPDGDGWRLRGEKTRIPGGSAASLFLVLARTGTSEGSPRRARLTAFLVGRDRAGVRAAPAGGEVDRGAATLELTDVRVSPADVLGEEGQGLPVALRLLGASRFSVGASAVGVTKRIIRLAAGDAMARRRLGRAISPTSADQGLLRQKLARMAVDCFAAESVVNLVAGLSDRGFEDTAVEAAACRVLATEGGWRTADEALQLAGGDGPGHALPFERALREASVHRLLDGTNDALRIFLALTAVGGAATELRDVAASVRGVLAAPARELGVLSAYARRRAALHAPGLPGGLRPKARFTQAHPALATEAAPLEEAARALALAVDRALRRHGRGLPEAQPVLRRLADVLIDLLAHAAALARVSTRIDDRGEAAAAPERDLLRSLTAGARRRVLANLGALDDHDDPALEAVAARVLEREGYGWDGE